MKRIIIASLLVLGTLTSCSIREDMGSPLSPDEYSFFAYNADIKATKTALQAQGVIYWLPKDEITVFYGENQSARFVADNTDPSAQTVFKGKLDGFNFKEGATTFSAVYPYKEENAFDGECITVSIPSEQIAEPNTFADDLFVSVAKTKDYSLQFYNVCGGIKFCVTETGVKRVIFAGKNGEAVAGTVKVGWGENDLPVIKQVVKPATGISLTCADGNNFQTGTWYYLAALPTQLEEGYKITLEKEDGTSTVKRNSKPIAVKRAIWGVLENLDDGLSYVLRVPDNEIWYTTTDGSILVQDYIEPGVNGLVSNTYDNGKGRLVFDYPLIAIEGGLFRNNSKLETIILPESVNEIGSGAFSHCESLRAVDMPGVVRVGSWAFEFSGLSGTLELPETLERIDQFAFTCCKSIDNLIIPERVEWMGEGAFFDGNLQTAVIRPITPPTMEDEYYSLDVRDNLYPNKTIIYVPEESLEAYQTAYGWRKCAGFMATEGKTPTECFYTSTDYSRDGEVILLQAATEGKGVNLIILGDGYTDKDVIPGGKYEQRVRMEVEDFFALEPYKTFRNRFNVYMINCVSKHDVYFTPFDADRLFTFDKTFNQFEERLDVCEEYARKVVSSQSGPIYATVFLNKDYDVEAAFCNILTGDSGYMAYAFLSDRRKGGDPYVFSHEMGGHGFARLADEYAGYERTAQESDKNGLDAMYNEIGWGCNVDWHSDPSEVRWSRFLSDSRYANEGLGVYEGGMVFDYGIYRCSEESVMNGTGPRGMGPAGYSGWFNAPSREAIYKQIMLNSEGPDWVYDYETFVAADSAGREQAAEKYKIWKVAYENFWAEQEAQQMGKSSLSNSSRQRQLNHRPPVFNLAK